MANFNLNKVILGGRLTADPELKQTQSGIAVVTFRMAVNRRASSGQQPEVDFFTVTAWRSTAEFVNRFFKKGSSICVIGSIQNRSWTDQQGQKRYATEIVADEINFVDAKGEGGGSYGSAPAGQYTPDSYSAPSYSSGAANTPKFEEISGDDDLPF